MALPSPTESIAPMQVGPAEFLVSRDPLATLSSGPLGAGIGVAVFDPEARAGGLLHALLPDSRLDPSRALDRPGLFLDTGLAALFSELQKLGAKPNRLVLCAAGGGEILEESPDFNLGGQMGAAFHAWIKTQRQRLHAEDVGGTDNRILRLNLALGQFRVRHVTGLADRVLCTA